MRPGFSERTFEFCYNAEYCQVNSALLATHPHMPSQRAEKDLGYDVEFKINNGHYTRSLFLQHKVSSFAEVRAGRNAPFYAVHGQPYFRFSVDNEQHNVLCELSRTRGNAFYCAPRFHFRHELETNFRGSSVATMRFFSTRLMSGTLQTTSATISPTMHLVRIQPCIPIRAASRRPSAVAKRMPLS